MPIETLTPELTEGEKEIVEERTALRAAVVHEAIREQGETELRRPVLALAWSGLAAGLSMGFSMISQGLLQSHLPDAPWRPLITNLGYSVGFLGVILGRQQLFTENTLTVILPLLARRHGTTLLGVGRLWSIVLVANLIGALAIAWVIGNTGIFTPNVRGAFSMIGAAALIRRTKHDFSAGHLRRMANRVNSLDAARRRRVSASYHYRDDLFGWARWKCSMS